MNQIGAIEILKARVYNLDAECHCELRSTVVVEPGNYPLYRDGMSTFWLMHGQLNQRGAWRMGDGMFGLYERDSLSGIEVSFPSKRFGPDEWNDLLRTPEFIDGHKSQRVRATITSAEEVGTP